MKKSLRDETQWEITLQALAQGLNEEREKRLRQGCLGYRIMMEKYSPEFMSQCAKVILPVWTRMVWIDGLIDEPIEDIMPHMMTVLQHCIDDQGGLRLIGFSVDDALTNAPDIEAAKLSKFCDFIVRRYPETNPFILVD